MTRQQAIKFLKEKPYKFGHMVGFTKLTPLHNQWMRKMLKVNGEEYTLLAHRGSYKTTCVAIVLALIMILLPRLRILFIRKTDTNVKEIIRQVRNILLHLKTQVFVRAIWNVDLKLTKDTDNELSTNLCTDTKGTSQLLGVGIGSVFTILANGAYGSALKLFPQTFALHPGAIFISLAISIFSYSSTFL